MDTLMEAAHEINNLWLSCLLKSGMGVPPEACPGDEEIAEIIERHLNESNTESIHSE